MCADCGDVKAGRKWKAWYTKAVGDIGGVTVVGMYDLEKRESDGMMRCMITRPYEGWVNLTDLVPLEGDDGA